ncbi:nickel ABC transporter ATP-binding protein NikE [Cohnella sp. GCM10020058]|uniref:nickel ABC transporter ATP-binding protein NikE n=1 Tax=Cohnella sp. GCM10020058 TaxID=3317330 RepID=UPI00362DDCB2
MLRIHDLQVGYPQSGRIVNVVNSVSFALGKGEVVALLGESGSGKSTIAKALTGMLPSSARIGGGTIAVGTRTVDALPITQAPWELIRGREIAMLHQDAQQALNPMLKIKAHFRESLLFHRLASADEVLDVSARLLRSLNFSDPLDILERYPFQLSGGMCQRICLALALCLKPAVLIADEPTSALDTVSQKKMLDLLKSMQAELGLTVLLITHDLAAANAIGDRVIVLNQGVVTEEGDTRSVLDKPKSDYTRTLLDSRTQISKTKRTCDQSQPQASLLEIVGLEKIFNRKKRVLQAVDLILHRSEILGILGQSGCGKSTLAKCIAGLELPSRGRILFRGDEISGLRGKSRRATCKYIQLVFQDARASLNPSRTALELAQEPLRYQRIGDKQARESMAKLYLDEVGLSGEIQSRRPPQLSTGQCQRIAIARALIVQPEALICDEAVSALDMNVQAQILALLRRLQQRYGFAILMISHDIRVLRSFCHRIAVMDKGSFCEVLQARSRLEESKQPYTQLLLRCAADMESGLE